MKESITTDHIQYHIYEIFKISKSTEKVNKCLFGHWGGGVGQDENTGGRQYLKGTVSF